MKHNIIKTDNYLLVVDDSEIKECYSFYPPFGIGKNITIDGELCFHIDAKNGIGSFTQRTYQTLDRNKKIIAHLPLNNSPILEGVDLLPPLEQDDVEKLAKEDAIEIFGNDFSLASLSHQSQFKRGYNKAKEKYKFTEEDMFIIRNQLVTMLPIGDISAWDMIQSISKYTKWLDEYVESLSQPKLPVEFECEMVTMNEGYADEKDYPYQQCEINKTTTNSQGQKLLVGKYIY